MIFIIIPIFNARKHLQGCLESLQAQTFREFEITIVDDGSKDGSAEFIRERFPQVRIVTGTGDWWWTRSMNEGIRDRLTVAKPGDFVLSLNIDLHVGPDYLERLLETEAGFRPCLTGSVSVDQNVPDRLLFCGVQWNAWTARHKTIVAREPSIEAGKRYYPTAMLPGRGTLIPVEMFRKAGMYNESHFPQYVADDDLSLRAAKAGYRLVVSPDAKVHSDVGSTGANFKIDKRLSPISFWASLWSIRSPFYLKARYHFALAHGRAGPLYFALDLGRILGSYLKAILRSFREAN